MTELTSAAITIFCIFVNDCLAKQMRIIGFSRKHEHFIMFKRLDENRSLTVSLCDSC